MDDNTRQRRITQANLILQTFCPAISLYHSRELRMCWDIRKGFPARYDFPARLTSQGSWTCFGYRERPTGGTGMQALAQLIRYVRDLPRLPLASWEYWCGDTVKLGDSQTLALLRLSEYGDPSKTCCVFCGTTEYRRGLDWWSLDGKVGPGCRSGCRGEIAA